MARSLFRPKDTSADSFRVQLDALRRLGETGRARAAMALSDMVRAAVEAGVRLRHPEYGSRTVNLAATRLMIGDDLFRAVHPGVEVEP